MEKFLGRGSDDSKVRKTEFLDILIHHGSDNAYKAAAYFEKGYGYEEAERIIFEEIGGVKDRQDCSDFILQLFCIFITVFMTGFPNSFVRLLKRQLWDIVIGLMSRVMMLCGF